MSEPTAPQLPGPVAPQTIDLVIRYNPQTSQITVNGPIDNKLLSFGLLELAKEVITAYNQKQGEQLVQPANFILPKS